MYMWTSLQVGVKDVLLSCFHAQLSSSLWKAEGNERAESRDDKFSHDLFFCQHAFSKIGAFSRLSRKKNPFVFHFFSSIHAGEKEQDRGGKEFPRT